MKKILFAALAATTLFASCNKDNNEGPANGESKSVLIRIDQGAVGTRGEGTPTPNGTVFSFKSGHIYFLTAGDVISKHYTLSSAATDIASGGSNIKLSEITGTGVNIQGIPANATKIAVVGNSPVALATAGNFSAVQQAMIDASSQTNAAFDVDDVTIYGVSSSAFTLISGNNYSATVAPKPIAGRIELTDISLEANSHITGYKVKGVYVNNFYEKAQLGGTVVPANLKEYGAVAANYAQGQGLYTVANSGKFYDYYAAGTAADGTGLAKAPTAGKVWSYNLLAATAVPHIIIHLSDITCESGYSWSGDAYLTIKGFKNAGVSIPSFDGGNVYRIKAGDLKFALDDLQVVPELASINVMVDIDLLTWTIIEVTPEM